MGVRNSTTPEPPSCPEPALQAHINMHHTLHVPLSCSTHATCSRSPLPDPHAAMAATHPPAWWKAAPRATTSASTDEVEPGRRRSSDTMLSRVLAGSRASPPAPGLAPPAPAPPAALGGGCLTAMSTRLDTCLATSSQDFWGWWRNACFRNHQRGSSGMVLLHPQAMVWRCHCLDQGGRGS